MDNGKVGLQLLSAIGGGTTTATMPAIGPGTAGQWTDVSQTTTVAHGLGFTPFIIAFLDTANLKSGTHTYSPLDITTSNAFGTGNFLVTDITLSADNVNIYVTCHRAMYGQTISGNPLASYTNPVRYYVYRDTSQQ